MLWGDSDAIVPDSNFVPLSSIYPKAKKVLLKGVGHMPHLEDTGGFNGALLDAVRE